MEYFALAAVLVVGWLLIAVGLWRIRRSLRHGELMKALDDLREHLRQ